MKSQTMKFSSDLNPSDMGFFKILVGSYRRIVSKTLLDNNRGPEWLYGNAPFAVLAHNNETNPKFLYANATAQRWLGFNRIELMQMPSVLSSGSIDCGGRRLTLEQVAERGFVVDCGGLCLSKSGNLLRLDQGVIWQLRDRYNNEFGQAAVFSVCNEKS